MKNFKILKTAGVLIVALMLLAAFSVPQVDAAEYWKQKYIRFSVTAGETLATGDVVCISASDGYAYKADSDDPDLRPAVGVVDKGANAGYKAEIVVIGILAGQTQKTAGYRLYLSETAGEIATTKPTNQQILGWVVEGATAGVGNSTDYFINIQMPIDSGGALY